MNRRERRRLIIYIISSLGEVSVLCAISVAAFVAMITIFRFAAVLIEAFT